MSSTASSHLQAILPPPDPPPSYRSSTSLLPYSKRDIQNNPYHPRADMAEPEIPMHDLDQHQAPDPQANNALAGGRNNAAQEGAESHGFWQILYEAFTASLPSTMMFLFLWGWAAWFLLVGIWGKINPQDLCSRVPVLVRYHNALPVAALMGFPALVLSLVVAFTYGRDYTLRAYFDESNMRRLWFNLNIWLFGLFIACFAYEITEHADWDIHCEKHGILGVTPNATTTVTVTVTQTMTQLPHMT